MVEPRPEARKRFSLQVNSVEPAKENLVSDRLTIVFMPESAYGPTNNCIGIGKVLSSGATEWSSPPRRRGRDAWSRSGSRRTWSTWRRRPRDDDQDAGQFWTDFITETAPEFRKPTIEQLDTFIEPVFASLIDGATYCEPQLQAILDRARPDVIVEDNVNAFPALLTHGAPWVRIMSCNPLEMRDPASPRSSAATRSTIGPAGTTFRAEYERTHRDTWERYNAASSSRARRRCPTWSSSTRPTHLNLSIYPRSPTTRADARWTHLAPVGVVASATTDEPWDVPDRSATARARSSTCRSDRSVRPTST